MFSFVLALAGHAAAQSWEELAPAGAPPPARQLHSAVYDANTNVMIVFAGAGMIDGQVKTTGGVCLNGGKSGQMAFQARADYQNHAIGWLRKERNSLGVGTVVRFIKLGLSGKSRPT